MRAALLATLLTACSAGRVADVAGEAAFAVLMAADYQQTSQGVAAGWRETNPLLGPEADQMGPLPLYFAGTFVLHAAVAWLLPRPWRWVWQGAGCVVESQAVWNNGVRGNLPWRSLK